MKSTGLANYIATTGSIKAALDGSFLYLFSGPVPASADDAIDASSVMLCKISVNGDGTTGLTFASPATGGILTKTTAEVWKGNYVANGEVSFYRLCAGGDAGTAASSTAVRLQGTVGTTVASDAVLPSTTAVSGNEQDVSLFQIQ